MDKSVIGGSDDFNVVFIGAGNIMFGEGVYQPGVFISLIDYSRV